MECAAFWGAVSFATESRQLPLAFLRRPRLLPPVSLEMATEGADQRTLLVGGPDGLTQEETVIDRRKAGIFAGILTAALLAAAVAFLVVAITNGRGKSLSLRPKDTQTLDAVAVERDPLDWKDREAIVFTPVGAETSDADVRVRLSRHAYEDRKASSAGHLEFTIRVRNGEVGGLSLNRAKSFVLCADPTRPWTLLYNKDGVVFVDPDARTSRVTEVATRTVRQVATTGDVHVEELPLDIARQHEPVDGKSADERMMLWVRSLVDDPRCLERFVRVPLDDAIRSFPRDPSMLPASVTELINVGSGCLSCTSSDEVPAFRRIPVVWPPLEPNDPEEVLEEEEEEQLP